MTKNEFKTIVNGLKTKSDAELRDLYFTLKMDLKDFEIEAHNFNGDKDGDSYWEVMKGHHELYKNMTEELFAYVFEMGRRGIKLIP